MAGDSSSGFRRGILRFFTATKNSTERVKGRTNEQTRTWVSKREKGTFMWRFCAAFRAFVDYRGRVFFTKCLQKPLGMLTLLWLFFLTAPFCWPSFPWTAISRRLVSSALRCRLPSLGSLVNWPSLFARTFLSSSTSGLVGDLELNPFVWVSRQKRQRDLLPGAHTHSVKAALSCRYSYIL